MIDVDGRVPEGFTGGGLGPRTADEARDWLRREGVRFDTLRRADSGQRFYPWNWVDDHKAAMTATAATIERHSAGLPEELSALEALAASKLAPAQAIAVNQAILSQTPSDVRALNRLARAQRALGHRDEAAATFGRVLSIDRQNGLARKHLLELANELRER